MKYSKNIINIFKYLHLKTIYINFKLLPFKDAIKLPIVVSHKTKFQSLKGEIEILSKIHFAMIKIGFSSVGIFDYKYERTILELNGKIIFHGDAGVGKGSRISVGKNAILELGQYFSITASTTIIAFNRIVIGDDCLLSWGSIIMDTDFHHIYVEGSEVNSNKPIFIGKRVWLGMRCTVLKGTQIPNNCIIAANSLLIGKLIEEDSIYGGHPARILRRNITWN
ncbi:MAG TPA: acyltransferase [Prolixibacteraceae bacterium]|nr:acyltransferase [Prolixibacteraceae bacterium]